MEPSMNDIIDLQKKLFRDQLAVYYMLRKALEARDMNTAYRITEEMIYAAKECLKS